MTPPLITATFVAVAGLALAVRLAVDPDPFASSSAAVIALGVVMFTVIDVVGLLLVRGRWSRRLCVVLGLAVVAVAAVPAPDPLTIVAMVGGTGAVVMAAGRWLDAWIRGRPSALGPPPEAVIVLLGLLALVPTAGLASPGGLSTADGVLGAGAVLLAWGFGKAQIWSLWAIRLVLPVLGLAAAATAPPAGAVLILVVVAGVVTLAWTTPVRLAVQPLVDESPGPRATRPGKGGSAR